MESTACLSCHDGSLASGVIHGARQGLPLDLRAGHPVGLAYRVGRGGSLRPPASVDHRIRLPDGRVGCGSCHSPYSGERFMLVVPNDGSRLCLACHDF